jgi:hypothetical protein
MAREWIGIAKWMRMHESCHAARMSQWSRHAGQVRRQNTRPGRKYPGDVNQFTVILATAWFCLVPGISGIPDMHYDGFQIVTFEAGRGLWHARIRRADFKPVIIDGVSFPELEVGFAWSNPDAAIEDAKTRIDYLNQRCANVDQMRETAHA